MYELSLAQVYMFESNLRLSWVVQMTLLGYLTLIQMTSYSIDLLSVMMIVGR